MLSNPDIAPSASINRWIVSILTFHFTLVHVAGTHHGPDGLSRCPLQDEDLVIDDEEDFGDWIDQLHRFMHQINPLLTPLFPSPQSLPTFALSSDLSKFPMTMSHTLKTRRKMKQGYFAFDNG
jgi:hypothetical protein